MKIKSSWLWIGGIILVAGGYFGFKAITKKPVVPLYVMSAVQKGTLMTTISGSGQISVSNQVDLKAKGSGDVLGVSVTNGQSVKSGAMIAWLNASDALKAVRDAQVNLDSAKLSLAKLQQPTDGLTLLRAQNAITQAQESKQKSADNLTQTYSDSFNAITDTFNDLPAITTGMQSTFFMTGIDATKWNIDYYVDAVKANDDRIVQYKADLNTSFATARADYDQAFADYKLANRNSDPATIEALLVETQRAAKSMSDAVKNGSDFLHFYQDRMADRAIKPNAASDTGITNTNSYATKLNSRLNTLQSNIQTIKSDKDSMTAADRTIAENTASLSQLQAGADVLDVKSAQISITQRQNALWDAQQKLADYSVRAPFDGIVASINVKKGDSVSSGTSIATFITTTRTAEISLNEVDVAKIKVGQKASLTFDAVEGLEITGVVSEISTLGTVSQGVVTYTVKITFDTQDDRIKPGMSVSTNIITNVHQDVLMVDSSAVKTQGTTSYVEMFAAALAAPVAGAQGSPSATLPRRQTVTAGLSNDTSVEILNGLNEGDLIVSRTIIPTTTAAASSAPSLFGNTGNRGAAGGATRAITPARGN
jgi:HlyD family secretion protein